MRTIKILNSEKRGLIYNAVSSNGGQKVFTTSLKMMEDIYTKLSIDINLKTKLVKIEEKNCIAPVILFEDEYSFIQRCLKSESTPWENYVPAKLSQKLSEELSKIEFKEDPKPKEKEK